MATTIRERRFLLNVVEGFELYHLKRRYCCRAKISKKAVFLGMAQFLKRYSVVSNEYFKFCFRPQTTFPLYLDKGTFYVKTKIGFMKINPTKELLRVLQNET